MNKTKSKCDLGIILRVTLFVILSSAASTPLRIFVEAVIEGREEAPEFITVGFLIYAVAAKLVVGFGYIILGYKLPVKNTALRGFTYIMLIFFSSYLPNILGMIGGDGAIIEDSLSAGIVVVDALSYLLDGLILGLLMKRYDVPNPDTPVSTTKKQLLVACAINGFLFAVLNCITDLIFGVINDSWRLCSILKVSPEREASFYIVFTVFMFVAGLLLPLWNRYCLPADAYPSDTILFALKTAVIVWLPNVLIMAFFGTPVLLTLLYGTAYTIMLILCALVYRKITPCPKSPAPPGSIWTAQNS